jgi:hypothetical protein
MYNTPLFLVLNLAKFVQRLDLTHQLLRESGKTSLGKEGSWGVKLPRQFDPSSMSLLADPANDRGDTRRAALFLSNRESYLLFQLQVSGRFSDQIELDGPRYCVFSFLCSSGDIQNRASSMFLASASFGYNLEGRTQGELFTFMIVLSQADVSYRSKPQIKQ